MTEQLPPTPTGSTPEALFAQILHNKVNGPLSKLNSSSSVKVSRTTKGINLRANNTSVSTSLFLCRIVQVGLSNMVGAMVFNDLAYNPALDFTVTNNIPGDPSLSQSEVLVSKSLTARMYEGETIDGFPITYTYTDENNRTAVATMLGTEIQVCHPRYQLGDFIIMARLNNYSGVDSEGNLGNDAMVGEIKYYELSPDRKWAAAPDGYTAP
jgi:hypothetical protein